MSDLKIYLNIPSGVETERALAKKLGAKWDAINKGWWIDPNTDRQPFRKWLPRMYRSDLSPPHIIIDLVPQTTWFANLRSFLKEDAWKRLKKEAYQNSGYRCLVCGGKGPKHPVECHEQWEYVYDTQFPNKGTQKLRKLVALCPACHSIKHAGLANIKGRLEETIKHMMFINSWSQEECEKHIEDESVKYEKKLSVNWVIDLSILNKYMEKPIEIDYAEIKEIPPIIGVSFSYKNIHLAFDKIARTRANQTITNLIEIEFPKRRWDRLPNDCPAWATKISPKQTLINCISNTWVTYPDARIIIDFIQNEILRDSEVILLADANKKNENCEVLLDAVYTVHPKFMFVEVENQNSVWALPGNTNLSFSSFLKCLKDKFRFIPWKHDMDCGLEYIKETCKCCENALYRFSGIVLPVGQNIKWQEDAWKYYFYIPMDDLSSNILHQILGSLSTPPLYEGTARALIKKRANRFFSFCPKCDEQLRLDTTMGMTCDYTRLDALHDKNARSKKTLIYSPSCIKIDYLTLLSSENHARNESSYKCDYGPRWVVQRTP